MRAIYRTQRAKVIEAIDEVVESVCREHSKAKDLEDTLVKVLVGKLAQFILPDEQIEEVLEECWPSI